MEIMNYAEMVKNAQIINILSQTTIQCSRDYVASKEQDIIHQMMQYIYCTLRDVMRSDLISNKDFILHIQSYLRGNLWISTGPFGGDGSDAQIQVHFSRFGSILRVFMNDEGYWFSQHIINEDCLKYLINNWESFKINLDKGLQDAIRQVNKENQCAVQRQLNLHEAVKNFKI